MKSQQINQADADAMLDHVDSAQQQVQAIRSDIALLETMENALGLMTENMARVKRLAQGAQHAAADCNERRIASDEIRNLMMINILITEDTEFDGHFLFKNNVISMRSFAVGEVTLTTARIPDIDGVETGDFGAMLDSLDNAADVINRQYQRVGDIMRILLDAYRHLRWEIDLFMTDRSTQ